MQTHVYKCRGSHRAERQIKTILGCDPDIHSGLAGRGAFCLRITPTEREQLIKEGFKINKTAIR